MELTALIGAVLWWLLLKWSFLRDSIGMCKRESGGKHWEGLRSALPSWHGEGAQGRNTGQEYGETTEGVQGGSRGGAGHRAGIQAMNTGKGPGSAMRGRSRSPSGSSKRSRLGRFGRSAILPSLEAFRPEFRPPPTSEGWDEMLLKAPKGPFQPPSRGPSARRPSPALTFLLSPSGLPAHTQRNARTVWALRPSVLAPAPGPAPRSPSGRLLAPRSRSSPWCRRRSRRSNRLRSRQTMPARARGGNPACRGDAGPIGAPRTDLNVPPPPIAARLVGRSAGPAPRPV